MRRMACIARLSSGCWLSFSYRPTQTACSLLRLTCVIFENQRGTAAGGFKVYWQEVAGWPAQAHLLLAHVGISGSSQASFPGASSCFRACRQTGSGPELSSVCLMLRKVVPVIIRPHLQIV